MMDVCDVSGEFGQAKSAVCNVLEWDERARNDDLWLILMVWQKMQHIKLFVPYEKLGVMFKPETLSRVRRHVQNDLGLFLPSDPAVLVRRKVRADLIRSYYRGNRALVDEWQSVRYGVK